MRGGARFRRGRLHAEPLRAGGADPRRLPVRSPPRGTCEENNRPMAIRRFTRALTAVFMALTLAATVDLTPAAAAAKPAAVKPNVDPATIAAIIKQLYSLYQQYFGAKGLSLADATAQ